MLSNSSRPIQQKIRKRKKIPQAVYCQILDIIISSLNFISSNNGYSLSKIQALSGDETTDLKIVWEDRK